MNDKLKIIYGGSSLYDDVVQEAIISNFNNVEVFSINENGDISGSLRINSILFGLTGLNPSTYLIFGVLEKNNFYYLQNIECPAKKIEKKLVDILTVLPGHINAIYSTYQADNVHCYIAKVTWDRDIKLSFQSAFYQATDPFYLKSNNRFEIRKPRSYYYHAFDTLSDNEIDQLLEARRAINPAAVELTIPKEEVAAFLGLEGGNYEGCYSASHQAKGAFGSNEHIESTVYVRQNYKPYLPLYTINELIERTSKIKIRSSAVIVADNFDASQHKTPTSTFNLKNKSADGIYRLGGNVFEVLNNIDTIFSHQSEVFRDRKNLPEKYSHEIFSNSLKELVINGFAHGSWKSGFDHTRDDKHSWRFANSIAIVHFGNRVEVINKQAKNIMHTGIRKIPSMYAKGVNAVHLALKDIGLAQCKNNGIRTVQFNIMKMGMPSPIIINDVDKFRVALPLQNEFNIIIVPSGPSSDEEQKIVYYFVLKLFLIFKKLDINIVSSALLLTIKESLDILYKIFNEGFCEQHKCTNSNMFRNFIDSYYTSQYSITDDHLVREKALQIIDGMTFYPAPDYMSPATLLSLSRISMSYSRKENLKNEIWMHFKNEGVYGCRVDKLSTLHFNIIAEHRKVLGDEFS